MGHQLQCLVLCHHAAPPLSAGPAASCGSDPRVATPATSASGPLSSRWAATPRLVPPPAGRRGTGAAPAAAALQGSQPPQQQHTQAGQHRQRGGLGATSAATFAAPSAVARAVAADDGAATALPIRVVGIGSRTVGALSSLGSQADFPAEMWLLDHDAKQLQGSGLPNTALLRSIGGEGAEELLSEDDLTRVVGPVFLPDGSLGAGVTFLLASAGDGLLQQQPDGDAAAVEVAAALRAAGHFVVAAVTCPFEFEGTRKVAAASGLVEQLQQVAHMTVAVEQDVLSKSGGGTGPGAMTVAEAKAIADRALEHAVRCVATAVRVPELLVVSNRAAAWHGRARGNLRRRMTPPLQQLLTAPGTAALGRGQAAVAGAALRRSAAAEGGSGSAAAAAVVRDTLQALAADAVRAAAESPFLEPVLADGAAPPVGVVCSITLPAAYMHHLEAATSAAAAGATGLQHRGGGAAATPSATRIAAQAAGGLLVDLLPHAGSVLVSCQPSTSLDGDAGDGDEVRVEATLLVVRPPPSLGAGATSGVATLTTKVQRGVGGNGGGVAGAPTAGQQQQQRSAARPVRLPPSAWSAMSAIAGGSAPARSPAAAAAAARQQQQLPKQQQPKQQQQPGGANNSQRSVTAPSLFSGRPGPAASPSRAAPQQQQQGRAASPPQQPQLQPSGVAGGGRAAGAGSTAVGDLLVDSLTAQSLDLPPAAAKWRQRLRRQAAASSRALVVTEEVDDEGDVTGNADWDEGGGGPGQGPGAGGMLGGLFGFGRKPQREVSVRDRASTMLQQDRLDSGEYD